MLILNESCLCRDFYFGLGCSSSMEDSQLITEEETSIAEIECDRFCQPQEAQKKFRSERVTRLVFVFIRKAREALTKKPQFFRFPATAQISRTSTYLQIQWLSLLFCYSFTYSVAIENFMPIKVGERVSVYISIPVPLR